MTPLWWSIALAAIGILGIWLAGRKSHWGWAVGVLAQFLWITYAIVTVQWGFIASAVAYGAIYSLNWIKWRRAERTTDAEKVALADGTKQFPYRLGRKRPDLGLGWPTFMVGGIDWVVVAQVYDARTDERMLNAIPVKQYRERYQHGANNNAAGVHGGRGQEAQGAQPDPRTDPRRHAKDGRGRHVRRKGDHGTGQVVDATSATHAPRRGAVRAAWSRVNAALRAYGAAWLALFRSMIFW